MLAQGKPRVGQLALACAVGLAVGTYSTTTRGQDVTSALGAWGAAGAPPAPPAPGASSGNVSGVASGTGFFDASGVGQVRYKATVTSTSDAPLPPDAFSFNIAREQTFTLAEPARVAIPTYLTGNVSFNAAAPMAWGMFQASVDVYNAAGASQFNHTYGDSHFAPMGNILVSDKFMYTEATLPAGAYKVRSLLRIGGEGNRAAGTPIGNNATVNFFDGVSQGLATSVAAYPEGLGSSRAAVKAPAARTTFGVDGTGVQVGLVETGQPYAGHTALPGAGKLTVVTGTVAGDYRREHALATAGIIAGADADNSKAGIAPGATILSAPMNSYTTGFRGAVTQLLTTNPAMRVMSMSATTGDAADNAFVNTTVNGKPNLTFVKSAGNAGAAGTISPPGMAENGITVGAVNRTFARRAEFSSYGGAAATPMKPDIVAPGEYVLVPQARDTSGDGTLNDFGRIFLGDDFRYTLAQAGGGANTGAVSGTSFSAPHVAGAAALLHQYQMTHANHEADHRVIKAILLNSASTGVTRHAGGAWSQTTVGAIPGMTVTRSLDQELGAGMLDVMGALRQYQPDEIRAADDNAAANFNIDASAADAYTWDLEQVTSGGGKVNYLLGDIGGAPLRTTLTWDLMTGTGGGLQPLELRLFEEGADAGNPAGFDAMDLLLASTSLAGENVKLFDFAGIADQNGSDAYYLQVINGGGMNATFGIAVKVPEPAGAAALILLPLVGRRARRDVRRCKSTGPAACGFAEVT